MRVKSKVSPGRVGEFAVMTPLPEFLITNGPIKMICGSAVGVFMTGKRPYVDDAAGACLGQGMCRQHVAIFLCFFVTIFYGQPTLLPVPVISLPAPVIRNVSAGGLPLERYRVWLPNLERRLPHRELQPLLMLFVPDLYTTGTDPAEYDEILVGDRLVYVDQDAEYGIVGSAGNGMIVDRITEISSYECRIAVGVFLIKIIVKHLRSSRMTAAEYVGTLHVVT